MIFLAAMFTLFGISTAQVCPAIRFSHEVDGATINFTPLQGEIPEWVEVHFTLNSGLQTNVRMIRADSYTWTFPLALRPGDVVNYFFTYCINSIDCDTQYFEYRMENMPAAFEGPDEMTNTVLYVAPPQPVRHNLKAPSWGSGPVGGYSAQEVIFPSQSFIQGPAAFQQPSWGSAHAFAGAHQAVWGAIPEPVYTGQQIQPQATGSIYVAQAPPPEPVIPELPTWGLHAVQPVVATQSFVQQPQALFEQSWGGQQQPVPPTYPPVSPP